MLRRNSSESLVISYFPLANNSWQVVEIHYIRV